MCEWYHETQKYEYAHFAEFSEPMNNAVGPKNGPNIAETSIRSVHCRCVNMDANVGQINAIQTLT